MDGVGTPIIGRPRPLPGHDTPNPTQHPYTLKCEEPTNRGISTIRFQHAKYNHGNYVRRYWGTSPIGSRRTKPPISTPDAGVTGAGWTGGREQASRRGAERSEIARSRGRTGLATPKTTRRPLHPLRAATPVTDRCTRYGARHPLRGATPDQKRCTAYGSGAAHPITRTNAESARRRPKHQRGGRCTRYGAAAPVTGRDTRSEGVHCLRIGCSAPNHKNKRGICEAIADTHKAPGARAPGASAHSDQPTLHVAPSRPSVTVTPAAARRSRSSSARAQSLAARAAARSDSTARTSASNAECSAAAAPDAPAPMPACPRGLGNTLTGTARQRARARR